jgi:enoyl-CoA hydratase/carnithine racemase
LWAGLARLLEDMDPDVRVVVVRGAGGTLSAGLDLSLLDPGKPEEEGNVPHAMHRSAAEIIDQVGIYQRPFLLLSDPRFISVAVVEGHAVGAGFQLALACDLRIMSEGAEFCMRESALGFVPDLLGTRALVQAVGYARALEICATARTVKAEEAVRIGLAQAAAPADLLEDLVSRTVTALSAHPVDAVRATKALLQQAPTRSLADQALAERTAQAERLHALAGR